MAFSIKIRSVPGPGAAKHTKVKDEPIKDIFDNINVLPIEKLLQHRYDGDESKIPTIDYLIANPAVVEVDITAAFDVECVETLNEISFTFGEQLPELCSWLEALAGPCQLLSKADHILTILSVIFLLLGLARKSSLA